MRVLHIITGLGTGGAERMLTELLRAVDRRRFQPTVISLLDRGTYGPELERLGVDVHVLGLARGLPGPGALWRLAKLVRDAEPDLIQGWMYHGNLAATVAAPFAKNRAHVLWNVRGALHDLADLKRSTGWLVKASAPLAHTVRAIVYCTRIGMEQHSAIGFGKAPQVFIPNGFDCERLRPNSTTRVEVRRELGLDSEELVVGNVARYHPAKDHSSLLQAATLVPFRFVLAGPGVEALSREVPANVRVIGERRDVPRLMTAFDVVCSSAAHSEGFPNVLGEAMACGVPCVTTDVGDSAWVVGDTGIVVPPRHPAALAQALTRVMEMGPEARTELGSKARERVRNEFSIDSVARKYEHLWEAAAT